MPEALRLDYVSPLPPVRSGIADYSVDLLPHLAAQCDLRLVALPGQPVAPEIAERWPLASPEELGAGGRLPLYQMGNNAYHAAVYDLAMARPGVLTLHDLVLHHFLIDRTILKGDFAEYRRRLRADHGWIGEAAAATMRWPGGSGTAAQFALPAHRTLLRRQLGVLTHSRWAAEVLHEELDAPGSAMPIRQVPMGIPLGPEIDAEAGRALRRRYGLPLDRPVLGSVGFQTPMKRTEVVIRALATPELRHVHLMIAGEVAPILRFEETARAAGVADRVHCLGFLPFADFEAAIAACDLFLNLRYPTAGETSASLLRILALGKPAVVSDYAQSADLPADGVVKIPVGDGEAAALRERLPALLADRELLRAMGHAARRHIALHHRPEDSAAAMVAACCELAAAAGERRASGAAVAVPAGDPVVPPPTSLIARSLPGTLTVEGADAPWPEGERRRLRIRLGNRSGARWLAGERPDGGFSLEVRFDTDAGPAGSPAERSTRMPSGPDQRAWQGSGGWLGLPFDLDPGAEHVFELTLRRPLGPARLRIVPHVFGHGDFADLEVPVWEAEL